MDFCERWTIIAARAGVLPLSRVCAGSSLDVLCAGVGSRYDTQKYRSCGDPGRLKFSTSARARLTSRSQQAASQPIRGASMAQSLPAAPQPSRL